LSPKSLNDGSEIEWSSGEENEDMKEIKENGDLEDSFKK